MKPSQEKGSLEARLGVLRLGLAAITVVVITILISTVAIVYSQVSKANNAVDAGYSFGEYMGDVLPVIIPSSIIVIIAAVAIFYGYKTYLKRQSS